MRRFHSYGPVDSRKHFTVPRKALVRSCMENLMGDSDDGGRFFTIWAPRQTGKTWLMHQMTQEIRHRFGGRFGIAHVSCYGLRLEKGEPESAILNRIPKLMLDVFGIQVEPPETWEEWIQLFHKQSGHFEKPLILFLDDFDCLPQRVIDRVLPLFRAVYRNRAQYCIHGLVLIGLRLLVDVKGEQEAPFDIQGAVQAPFFSREEVGKLFRQYQEESGQVVAPAVIDHLWNATRGHPGLVGWFGQLLTDKYRPQIDKTIDEDVWETVYRRACYSEWNNTVLNLIQKVRSGYFDPLVTLFSRTDIRFRIDTPWCAYFFYNGVISDEEGTGPNGMHRICRFSNPFIQKRLYNALTHDLIGDRLPLLPIDPAIDFKVFLRSPEMRVPSLLEHYKSYLRRLREKGVRPWRRQPGRADTLLTEAVGHFHLYAWLCQVLEGHCRVTPEFPTRSGKVDLHLICADKLGVIETASFQTLAQTESAQQEAAAYANRHSLSQITIALFVSVEDEEVLNSLSGELVIDGVNVMVTAIGWI